MFDISFDFSKRGIQIYLIFIWRLLFAEVGFGLKHGPSQSLEANRGWFQQRMRLWIEHLCDVETEVVHNEHEKHQG